MFTKTTGSEKRLSIPGIEGVWFGTGRPDGSVLLRRHGKISRKDAISDIIMKENEPAPGSPQFTFFVYTLGSKDAMVINKLSELAALAKDGRLKMPRAKRVVQSAKVPRGWDMVVA